MPWFYVDDGFSDSKPVMNLPDHLIRCPARLAVCGLWVLGGSWSAKEELDGFIPDTKLRQLGITPTIRHLMTDPGPLSAPLFDTTAYGVVTRSWHKWQKTKAELEANRKREADKKRKWRAGQKGRNYLPASTDEDVSPQDSPVDTSDDSKDVSTGDIGVDSRARAPRPDPITEELTNVRSSVGPRKRGARLDPNWQPSPETISAMRTELGATINLSAEHRRFVDYWTDKTGKDATKISWEGTWRNWMRRAADQADVQRSRTTPSTGQSTVDRKVNGWLNIPIGNQGKAIE